MVFINILSWQAFAAVESRDKESPQGLHGQNTTVKSRQQYNRNDSSQS
jgi:hypothetical protein